jgi:DNA-nicking Smr family endonuclease
VTKAKPTGGSPLKSLADLKLVQQQLAEQQRLARIAAQRAAEEEHKRQAEATLFARTVGPVTPMQTRNIASVERPRAAPLARQREQDEKAALTESLSDEFDAATLLHTDDELSFAREGIGADVLRKLRRGEWSIQSQIDLHGLRSDEARIALSEFIRDAVKLGQRCVRVVHGKGLGSEGKAPVLKAKVKRWLAQKSEVIAFCQASPAHGGAGALLVLLRPSRTER